MTGLTPSWPTVDRSSRLASEIAGLTVASASAALSAFAAGGASELGLGGGSRLRRDLLLGEQGMRKPGRGYFAWRDDDPRAHLGPVPHPGGERHRHADAAMRRRIARQHAGMHRDARPGDPLHERHRRAAIDVGMVQLVLLNDAEDAHRRRMALHARGDRRFREKSVGVVDLQVLPLDRDRDDQRALRLGATPSAPRPSWPDAGERAAAAAAAPAGLAKIRARNPTSNTGRLQPGKPSRSLRPPSKPQFAKTVRSQSPAIEIRCPPTRNILESQP